MTARVAAAKPSGDALLADLDRQSTQLLTSTGQVLEAVRQLTGFTATLRNLAALADTWDTQAAEVPLDAPAAELAAAGERRRCAQQLRAAIEKGAAL